MNNSNFNLFNDENPLSDDEFQVFLNYDLSTNDTEHEIDNYDSKWFTHDGLFPYAENSSTPSGTNCSDQLDFFLEMNKFFSPSQIVVPVIYSIICLVGLIGNGLVSFKSDGELSSVGIRVRLENF